MQINISSGHFQNMSEITCQNCGLKWNDEESSDCSHCHFNLVEPEPMSKKDIEEEFDL